ncbi:hypothetical protein [Streptomyces sp. NPDC092307]|uniref:hypothetical protein n=1 Tax=Streptomyces sp. NPDC092307 TaxID=3366013 RepID=UPI00380B2A80
MPRLLFSHDGAAPHREENDEATWRLTGLGVATALAAVGAAGPARAEGNVEVRRVLTVMVNFQDSKLENPDALRAVIERTYFGKTDSMSAYYAEVSLGRTRFEPPSRSGSSARSTFR